MSNGIVDNSHFNYCNFKSGFNHPSMTVYAHFDIYHNFSVNHFVVQNVKKDNSRFSVNHSITFIAVDEEECHLREQVFEFVRNVIQLKLTESQLALFSAVVLIRAGQC